MGQPAYLMVSSGLGSSRFGVFSRAKEGNQLKLFIEFPYQAPAFTPLQILRALFSHREIPNLNLVNKSTVGAPAALTQINHVRAQASAAMAVSCLPHSTVAPEAPTAPSQVSAVLAGEEQRRAGGAQRRCVPRRSHRCR